MDLPQVVLVPKRPDGRPRRGQASGDTWLAPTPKWGARARARSRSPVRPALPGLRDLAPGRLERRRARVPDLSVSHVRDQALAELDKDTKAKTTHVSDDSRLATMTSWVSAWGLPLFPPTTASFKAIAATLKMGNYKSAQVYLTVYRVEAERRGFAVTSLLARSLKDWKRSCSRGLGGPVRPRPLPLDALGSLPAARDSWVEAGPINPRAAVLTGAWWLCRELELSTSRARLVELCAPSSDKPSIRWHLPASKNDTDAIGAARSLSCCCTKLGRSGCPVHCMWDHLCFLAHRFPSKFEEGVPTWDLPLFPSASGDVVPKAAMAKTIEFAATCLGIPLSAPDGSERISGHSLRVSGAQGLARMGWDLWAIQLHGRWQSDVVKHYVRDASLTPVGDAGGPAQSDPLTLELIVRRVLQKLGTSSRVGKEALPSCTGSAAPHPVELRHVFSAELPTLVAEPELKPELLVLHMGSGIYHRRPERSSIRTVCGWSFGDSESAVDVPDHTAGPHGWFQLCGRCWPRARAAAKGLPEQMALCK